MSEASTGIADRAGELRRAFDRSFAEPLTHAKAGKDDVLAIRIGAEACAIRLADITGVYAGKKITPLPGHAGPFLGFAGFRGTVVPVYSLRRLFGHVAEETQRWLVIAAKAPLALAFDAFEGHLQTSSSDIVVKNTQDVSQAFVSGFVRRADLTRAVIDMPAILDAIQNLTTASHAKGPRDHV